MPLACVPPVTQTLGAAPQLTERGWCERLVDIAPDEDAAHLRFVLSPGPTPASRLLVDRRLASMQPEDASGAGQGSPGRV